MTTTAVRARRARGDNHSENDRTPSTVTRGAGNRNRPSLTERDAALVAAAVALREAEKRLGELLAFGEPADSHADPESLRVYAWQAGRAASDIEVNHATPAAALAVALATGEKWARLVTACEDATTPRQRRRAMKALEEHLGCRGEG